MNYKHVYFNYFGYCFDDIILCEVCGRVAVDIHHITYRSHSGKGDFNNLIALCRVCHNKAHGINGKLSEKELRECKKY